MMSDLSTKKKNVFSISQYSFILIFIALFIVYFLFSTSLTWTGATNILRHSAVIGVISLGMGLVIVTGDIDLSVGAMLSFVSSFACIVFNLTDSIFLVLCFCLLSGTLLGLINGVMIGKFRLPAFICDSWNTDDNAFDCTVYMQQASSGCKGSWRQHLQNDQA